MFHRPKNDAQDQDKTQNQGAKMSESQENNHDQNTNQSGQSGIGIPGSGFSRVSGARPNIPGSYPGYGASPSYSSGAAHSPSHQHDNGRKLIVGQGISMSGEIDSCDHLIVEGKVEAALRGAKLLDITENGTFFGTVEIEEANVAGTFEGDLTVTGRLTIKAGGSITGEISYGELAIEAGATVDGSMRPLNSMAKNKQAAPKIQAKANRNHNQQAQNIPPEQNRGAELPFTEDKKVAAAE